MQHTAQMKRWTVTYTKHLTQKRKVYHDGVLELGASSHKVLLYDDCEKLIDSRFLKQDEVVEYGATLTFETHLVDVGEPEGDHEPHTDLDVSGVYMKLNERSAAQGQKKITSQSWLPQNYSNAFHSSIKENKKSKLHSRPSQNHSNAISSSIRVSNKAELSSFGILQNHPDAIQTATKEWDALYTTQKSQKAKKYHDGVLQLAVCGSHMNQVILLNEDGAVLSSKYLKSLECFETGHTFEFPNYLVEIGDPRISLGDKKGNLEKVAISINSSTSKFSASRKDNSNKPLPTENIQKGHSEQAIGCSSSNAQKLTTCRKLTSNKQLRDACHILSILKKPFPEECPDQRKLPAEHTISSYPSNFTQVDGNNMSKKLEFNTPGTRFSRKTVTEDHKGVSQELSIGGSTQTGATARPCLDSKANQTVSSTNITILIDPDYEGSSPMHEYSTSNQLSGALEFHTRTAELNTDNKSNKCTSVITSAAGTESLDSNTCTTLRISEKNTLDSIFSEDELSNEPVNSSSGIVLAEKAFECFLNGKQHIADSSSNPPKENTITDESSSLYGGGGNSLSSVNTTKYENSDQLFAENTKAEERCDRVPYSGSPSPACAATDPGFKDSVFQNMSRKCPNVDNSPSFDLLF